MWTWKRNQIYLKQKQEKNLHLHTEKTSLLKCKDQDTDTRTRSKLMKHRNVWWVRSYRTVFVSAGAWALSHWPHFSSRGTSKLLCVCLSRWPQREAWFSDWFHWLCWFADWFPGREETEGGAGGLLLCFYFFRVGGWGGSICPALLPACLRSPSSRLQASFFLSKQAEDFLGAPSGLGPAETWSAWAICCWGKSEALTCVCVCVV